jgi:hypothetical protein
VLAAAGWEYDRADTVGEEHALHPDGIMSLRRRTDDAPSWTAEASLPTGLGGQECLWHAYFSEMTPVHLIAGFTAALASPDPVHRGMFDVPQTSLVTEERTSTQGEQLLAAHTQRLKQVRAATRRSRRATRQPSVPPSPAAVTVRTR